MISIVRFVFKYKDARFVVEKSKIKWIKIKRKKYPQEAEHDAKIRTSKYSFTDIEAKHTLQKFERFITDPMVWLGNSCKAFNSNVFA